MDPVTLAPFLREFGGWALSALLVPALVWAIRGWMGCFEARIADATKVAVQIERSSQTMAAIAAALESRQGHFERLGLKTDGLEHKIDDLVRAVDDLRRRP